MLYIYYKLTDEVPTEAATQRFSASDNDFSAARKLVCPWCNAS